MSYLEIILIVRGYRRRNVLTYQLLRINAYHSLFAFRSNEHNKLPQDLWPLYFDKYKDAEPEPSMSDEEANELQEEMAAMNKAAKEEFYRTNQSLS